MVPKHIAAAAAAVLFAGSAGAQTLIVVSETGPRSERLNMVVLSEGYTQADLDANFRDDAEEVLDAFLRREPFRTYRNLFNTYLIAVASNESGADDPSEGISRDTYFNATFDTAGIDRLLAIDSTGRSRAFSLLGSLLPEYDIPMVLVNDSQYGGSGGNPPVASTHSESAEIMIHEVGHSFADLTDEYTTDSLTFTPYETINATARTDREVVRWKHWIDPSTPVPTPDTSAYNGVVGLFEGAMYRSSGWYRPTRNSLMRNLNREFEPVNEEQFVLRFFDRISPVASVDPAPGPLSITDPSVRAFSLTLRHPVDFGFEGASWQINGEHAGGSMEEIDFIARGDIWRYLDTGVAPAAGWTGAGFADEGWKSGAAELGYGDGDESTVVENGGVTAWFRKAFVVADASRLTGLAMEIRRDDGAIVYVNGAEIHRTNMASGVPTPTTLAFKTVSGSEEDAWYDVLLDPAILADGPNVMAVEIHKSSTTSSDLSFDLGLRGRVETPAMPAFLVAGQSAWSYLDTGVPPAAEWTSLAFDDGAWATGSAEFGYGDGDETTVVGFGGDENARHITTWFRKTFAVADPSIYETLDLQIRRDDGAVVHVNGSEFARSNMPEGAVTPSTFSTSTVSGADEDRWFALSGPASSLVAGTNVIAVEIHQRSETSTDISFDLQLRGVPPVQAAQLAVDPVALGNGTHRIEARVFDPTDKVRQDPDDLTRKMIAWEVTVALEGDTDGDGLLDTWEVAEFGSLEFDADDDPDGDRQTNAEEQAAGTRANDSSSRFEVLESSVSEGGNAVALRWRSAPGRSYRISGSRSLESGDWTLLKTVAAAPGPADVTETEVGIAGPEAYFLRVEISE